VEASIFWRPWYRLSAVVKVMTAFASWATVVALIPILPKALALPGLKATTARLPEETTLRKRSEEMFKLALETSPSGMLIVDPKGKIHFANDAALTTFGYERNDLVGRLIEDLAPVARGLSILACASNTLLNP
jgi:PAS domain-containing protein